jgi:hypothetical protein
MLPRQTPTTFPTSAAQLAEIAALQSRIDTMNNAISACNDAKVSASGHAASSHIQGELQTSIRERDRFYDIYRTAKAPIFDADGLTAQTARIVDQYHTVAMLAVAQTYAAILDMAIPIESGLVVAGISRPHFDGEAVDDVASAQSEIQAMLAASQRRQADAQTALIAMVRASDWIGVYAMLARSTRSLRMYAVDADALKLAALKAMDASVFPFVTSALALIDTMPAIEADANKLATTIARSLVADVLATRAPALGQQGAVK